MQKNVSGQKWRVFAFDETDNTPLTGSAGAITAKISLDWGTLGAITDTNPVEQEDGYYLFDLTQGETDGNVLDIFPECSTSNMQVIGVPGSVTTTISETANTNLELQFDGTGYVDDTAPSTQAQMSNIANVGSAVNVPAESYTLTTGNQTANTFGNTAALNGTRHTHTDNGSGVLDLFYEFNVGGGTPSSVKVTGALTGQNDDLEVHGFDWVTTTWGQVGIVEGKVSTANEVNDYDLYATMVGTGSDLGKVRIRFFDGDYTLSSATLYIDQIFASYSQGSGDYANGAIWVDTNASNTNTVSGIDGVSTNPVSTWAAALTLSANLNIKRFHIANGSDITFSANSDSVVLIGDEYDLDLNGQSIELAHITGGDITGTGLSTSTHPTFEKSQFGTVTIPPCFMYDCGFGYEDGVFTGGSAGQYVMHGCYSVIPGSATPTLIFTGLGSTTGINNRGWLGGSHYTLDANCTVSHEALAGGGQTFVTGGASVELRGIYRSATFTLSNAGTIQTVGVTGVITLSGTSTATINMYGISSGLADTSVNTTVNDCTLKYDTPADALTTYDPPTRTEATADKDEIIVEVDANETKIDTAITDIGNLNDLSSANVTTACTSSLNTYDPPTRAELTTDTNSIITQVNANETKIDTSITDIGNLNDLSSANVTSATTTALNSYDPPTKSEMDTAHGLLATEAKQDIMDTNIDQIETIVTTTGVSLTASGIDAIFDEVTENSITLRQAVNLFLSVLTGKSSGGGTTTLVFRSTADDKDRLSVTVDSNGNRTAVGTRTGA